MAGLLWISPTESLINTNLSKQYVEMLNSSSTNMSFEKFTNRTDFKFVTSSPPDNIEAEHYIKPLIPKSMMIYIDIYSHIVVPFIVSSFGVVSNVINLIIFTRLGLRDGMSVGLWCLSFSDLTVTGQTLGSSICSLCGLMLPRDTPISPGLVHYVSLLWSQDMMYLVSNWITTFISLERCCCVIWPFKVKSLFTRTRSVFVIVMIFVVHIASYAPIFASHRLEFVQVSKSKQDASLLPVEPNRNYSFLMNSTLPEGFNTSSVLPLENLRNETESEGKFSTPSGSEDVASKTNSEKTLRVTFSKNRAVIHHTVDIVNGAVLPVVQQALVIASAGGLAYGLKATSKVRGGGHAQRSDSQKTKGSGGGGGDNDASNTKPSQKTSGLSQKEVRLVKVVAVLALILTICNIPRFIAVYTTLLIPEMHIGEAYENMYVFLWALTALFASVNASVNIFVYLTVNSAYRTQFKTLFRCLK